MRICFIFSLLLSNGTKTKVQLSLASSKSLRLPTSKPNQAYLTISLTNVGSQQAKTRLVSLTEPNIFLIDPT